MSQPPLLYPNGRICNSDRYGIMYHWSNCRQLEKIRRNYDNRISSTFKRKLWNYD